MRCLSTLLSPDKKDQDDTSAIEGPHQVHVNKSIFLGPFIACLSSFKPQGVHMHRIIATLFLLSSLAHAQVENLIQFHGQENEIINIEKMIQVTRSVPVEVPSTCTRQIPYDSYECNNETRYRQECTWIPEAQRCWQENERECRSVTRSRRECSPGPSHRVCTDRPSREVCTDRPDRQECTTVTRHRQECSTGPGRQVCTPKPSREVCTERPTREVCTERNGRRTCSQVGGGRTCNTVGGGQECRTVPGERECRSVPYQDRECRTVSGGRTCSQVGGGQHCEDVRGPEICRDVSYQDQDCHDVPRNRCQTVAGHDDCRNIPYSEEVCGNVIRYNQEQYACTRTEQQERVFEKMLKGQVQVDFKTNGQSEEFPLSVILSSVNGDQTSFVNKVTLTSAPQTIVSLQENKVKVVAETESSIILEGAIKIELLDPALLGALPTKIKQRTFNWESEVLTLTATSAFPSKGSVSMELSATTRWLRRGYTVAKLDASYPSDRVQVVGNKLLIKLSGLVIGTPKNGMNLDLKVKSTPTEIEGEILNTKKPKLEEVYTDLQVLFE